MLKTREVFSRLCRMTCALQRPSQAELSRSVQRVDLDRLLEGRNGLVELPHLLITGALEVPGVCIPGIDLRRLLKAGQRGSEVVACVLHQTQVVPSLRAVRIDRNRLSQRLLCGIKLLQGE